MSPTEVAEKILILQVMIGHSEMAWPRDIEHKKTVTYKAS